MRLVKSNVRFNQEAHTYTTPDGRELSGVTALLGRTIFAGKYAGIDEGTLRRAAERGTVVHEQCELADSLGIVADSPEVRNYQRLKAENGLGTAANEYLVSDNENYASCIDIVFKGTKENSFSLADIKTTYKLDTEYVRWQLSIYRHLFLLQNPGAEVERLYAVWLRGETAEMKEVEAVDGAEVERLLAADLAGDTFTPAATPDGELPAVYREAESAVASLMMQIQELEAKKKMLAEYLQEAMGKAGCKTWRGEKLTLSRREASTRESIDTKALKSEMPEIYAKYCRYSAVKESITIKTKQQ